MTMKQLIVSAVGGGIAYLLYLNLETQPMAIWLPPVGLVGALTAAIAFLKINNIPFTQYVLYAVEKFMIESKRHWVKSAGDIYLHEAIPQKKKEEAKPTKKQLTAADIARISQNLDADDAHQLTPVAK